MKKEAYKIHIIGSGISGLIAALTLERHGYTPVIIEATDRAGGRVKTDVLEGHQLDHGFQVLLTAYPAAQRFLDFEKLALQPFLPGAVIFDQKKQKIIGDPLRKPALLLSTLFSNIGSFSDKLKVLKLNASLKKKTVATIFQEEEKTTSAYLQEFGFSSEMIETFFKPFFSGIFLEPHLSTSSRMFEFVYKMFGEGYAAIPKGGMEAIIQQLTAQLKTTTFKFNTRVKEVQDAKITLVDGSNIDTHFTLIAGPAHGLVPNLKNQKVAWQQCETLYFTTEKRVIMQPLIGLIPDTDAWVNNIFYHTSLETTTPPKNELLSVTVVKNHSFNQEELIQHVQKDLEKYCGITATTFLKRYTIKNALPKLTNLQSEIASTETKLTNTTFLAGDQLLNGSLNAAMVTGEQAALGIINTLEDGSIVGAFTSEFA